MPPSRNPLPGPSRPPAFILLTDLPKAGGYLRAIAARELRAMVITGPPQWPMEHMAVSYVGAPGHPFESIHDLAFLASADMTGILLQITIWAAKFDIKGIFASSEIFVAAAGQAADLLGLPGIGLRAARVCRNKHLQRLYLPEWSPVSIPSSSPRKVISARLGGRYPLIAKPLDLYCSIGVRTLRSPGDLESYLDSAADGPAVLIEERLTGREFSVESLVAGGDVLFSVVTQKATNEDEGDFFVEMGHTVPAANVTAVEESALKAAQAAVLARLEFGTGMVHGEYRILPEGRVALMEIAARPAGDGILHLCRLATGASIETAVVDAALGLAVNYPEPSRWARQIYFEHEAGKLQDVVVHENLATVPYWITDHGLWPDVDPTGPEDSVGVRKILVLKARDAQLGELTDSFGRAVTALYDAPGPDELDSFERILRESVQIIAC